MWLRLGCVRWCKSSSPNRRKVYSQSTFQRSRLPLSHSRPTFNRPQYESHHECRTILSSENTPASPVSIDFCQSQGWPRRTSLQPTIRVSLWREGTVLSNRLQPCPGRLKNPCFACSLYLLARSESGRIGSWSGTLACSDPWPLLLSACTTSQTQGASPLTSARTRF